ncbi:MAG: hypothetical protein A2Y38_08820 [Spirochaetes bacterium GWB1_59_5]|nr:MAG: hypothetical protein A2Y38_08820 [Spirochaetes bacterium GWB1_59_5]
MTKRQRMTWAADKREAAAPPAIPGYDVEDQDHPAKGQPDPDAHQYENGDTSSWNEDPAPPPYGDSGAPALPGYGVEDQDHPAHRGQVGRQANLGELVRRKSAKCLKLARKLLGKNANQACVEDQALDFMDLGDDAIEMALGRAADMLMAEDEPKAMDEPLAEDEPVGGMWAEDEPAEDEPEPKAAEDDMAARLSALEAEIRAMRRAASKKGNQNDPNGPTLGASGKSAEQEKAEEKAINSKQAALRPVLAMFDSYDHDRDGFITAAEWKGPRSLFAALDTDKDGIIARFDLTKSAAKKAEDDEPEAKDAGKKGGKKGEKKSEDEEPEEGESEEHEESESKEEEEAEEAEGDEEKDEKEAGKKGGKKAGKKGDDEEKEAGKKGDDEEKEAGKKGGKKGGAMPPQFKENAQKKKDEAAEKDEKAEDEKKADKKAGKSKKAEDEKESEDKESEDEKAEKKAFGATAELDDEELAMLHAMQFGQDEEACEAEDGLADPVEDFGTYFANGDIDPMGLSDGDGLTAEDEATFAAIFGKSAGDESEEKEAEDEEKEAEDKKEAEKKAGFKPQPRKAPTAAGPKTLGAMSRTASAGRNEIEELSKLWTSAPDVKGAFGQ